MKIVNLETGTMEYPLERKLPWIKRNVSLWEQTKAFCRFTRESVIDENYYLFIPFHFKAGGINYKEVYLQIPKGTVVNGASVPKLFRSLVSPNGVLYIGSIFHDFFYESGGISISVWETELNNMLHIPHFQISQKEADDLFYGINNYITGLTAIPYTAYLQLRLFGWIVWNKYRRNDNENCNDIC